jgi:hypothetical protein
MALIWLEVGVEVLLAVFGIDELVETVAFVVVVVLVHHANNVFRGEMSPGQPEAIAIPGRGINNVAVDLQPFNRLAAEVQEQVALTGILKGERAIASVRFGTPGED